MRVKLILPALTEAKSPFFRPVKYSLFPPLGLATLAGYLDPDDEVVIEEEHVEDLSVDDEPDLVGIEVYITSARRAYALADLYQSRGAHVVLGGLQVTSCPEHAVFQPARMDPDQLEGGYWRAYRDFYRFGSILEAAATKPTIGGALRHAAYAIGWKKGGAVWDLLIRGRRVACARPLLEAVLQQPVLRGPGHRRRSRREAQLRANVRDVTVDGVAAEV